MKSEGVKQQIEAMKARSEKLTTARETLQKRVTFLGLQAASLEYPAGQGDTEAQAQRAAMLGELDELREKIRANELEAQAVQENITAYNEDYHAARLAEETARRDRAALEVIASQQEIIKHREAIQALTDSLPAAEAKVRDLNGIVVSMGGQRLEITAPAGSDETKTKFYEDTRGHLLTALS